MVGRGELMCRLLVVLAGISITTGRSADAQPAGMPQIDPQDPRRFVMDGQPWYPAGYYPGLGTMTIRSGSTTLQEYMTALIDKLSASGINYCRLVLSMHQGYGGLAGQESFPYIVVGSTAGDGYTFPVVDLDQFNQAHFDYVRGVLEHARDVGVVVQLCIFDSWHINNVELPWHRKYDFYSPGMNANGVAVTSGEAWHSTDPQSVAWQRHTVLARKAVDSFGDLPNIVWEISNEPNKYYDGNSYPGRPAPVNNWTMQMGAYVKNYELTSRGYNHVCMPVDLPDHQHTAGQRPDFFGTATNENDGHTPAGTRRDLLYQIANSTALPGPQPLIADNDAGGSALSSVDRRRKAWACLTTGSHIDYFHYELNDLDVLHSQDVSDGMRWIGYTHKFLSDLSVNLRGMVPADDLVSNGWCCARAGSEYIVYLGSGGATTVSQMSDFCEATWFNPRNGANQPAAGGPTFIAPDGNDWVLHVRCVGRAPFHGAPATLPGRVEAEDHDLGGEGVGYHDTTPGNDGGAYRDDDVDIEATADVDGDYHVGWIAAGEWLEYLVNVSTHGLYDIHLRVAADPAATGSIDFHFELDGTDVTGPQSTPPTAGWQDFKTVTVGRVELTPGTHVLRLAMDSSSWNVNWFEAALVARIVPVDFDHDGDVDLEDFGAFQLCLSGSGIPHPPGCEAADLNQDTAVDQVDVAVFLGCLGGANLPPGC